MNGERIFMKKIALALFPCFLPFHAQADSTEKRHFKVNVEKEKSTQFCTKPRFVKKNGKWEEAPGSRNCETGGFKTESNELRKAADERASDNKRTRQ
jgi:hypothetical protein